MGKGLIMLMLMVLGALAVFVACAEPHFLASSVCRKKKICRSSGMMFGCFKTRSRSIVKTSGRFKACSKSVTTTAQVAFGAGCGGLLVGARTVTKTCLFFTLHCRRVYTHTHTNTWV